MDGDQEGDESVSNAPTGSRSWAEILLSVTKGCGSTVLKSKQSTKITQPCPPHKNKQSLKALRRTRTGRREPRKVEGVEVLPLTPTPRASESAAEGSAEGEGALWVRSPRARSASSSRPLSLRLLGKPPRTPPPCWVRLSDSD